MVRGAWLTLAAIALAGTGLAGCVHEETAAPPRSDTVVVQPPPANPPSKTVVVAPHD